MSGQRRRGPMGGHGPGMRPDRKSKRFQRSMGKLFRYMSRYKLRFVMVFIFAVQEPFLILQALRSLVKQQQNFLMAWLPR